MEYVTALANSLAWPLTVLILVFALRQDLRAVLTRITRFKYGDAEIELAELREQVATEKAKQVLPEQVEAEAGNYFDRRLAKLTALAEHSSRAAVLEAWIELERAIFEAAKQRDLANPSNVREAVEYLASRNAIPTQYISAIDELRRIRNVATHSPSFDFTASAAVDFVSTAVNLAFLICLLSGLRTNPG